VLALAFLTVAEAQPPAIGKCTVLPADNIWNTPVDQLPVAANSAAYINTISSTAPVHADFGAGLYDGGPIGIPFITVPGTQTKYPATFLYADESDPGPYAIPLNAPIEGGSQSTGDRHTIAVDIDNCILYELYSAYPQAASWQAGSGAIFNLLSDALRPAGWTSTDAAGLPILPGLMRYDEIAAGEIRHAVRFTVPETQRAYVWPARHYASSLTDPKYPPMGLRVRLRADFDISGFSATNQIILLALKKYGMMLADNGSAWYISGAPDSRWDNDDLHNLGKITGSAFEVVDVSSLMVDPNSGQALQSTPPGAWSITKSHNGSFAAGQNGAAYTISVSNSGAGATSGTATVTDTVPSGLTLASMAGPNWNCSANTCTRRDALGPAAAYPPITVTVNVASSAPASLTNQATISGGGAASVMASDPTAISGGLTPMPTVTSLSPVVSAGASQSYVFQFSDAAGWQALSVVNVLINNFLDGRQACYVAYSVPNNVVYLVSDSGAGLLTGLALNGSGATSNSQCTVSGAGSSASGSGSTLVLTLSLSFNPGFAGNKAVYMAARDVVNNSGWQTMGVLGVPPLPAAFPSPIGMSPSSGTAAAATLTFTYQDANSAGNLQTTWALINTALDGRAACYVAYYAPGNQVFLVPDNGMGNQAASMGLSGANRLANSQCTVSEQGSSVVRSGAQIAVSLNISFNAAFVGPKVVWMAAQTLGGAATSGWQALGAWNVPGN